MFLSHRSRTAFEHLVFGFTLIRLGSTDVVVRPAHHINRLNILNYPLVTFAVLGYNQENYIRKAIEGAFAQEYSRLEIVLSDDESSDSTYEIMCEMAAGYFGPHAISVRKSDANAGTLMHVLEIARMCSGDYLVVAGGDDISLPSRTQVSVDHLIKHPRLAYSAEDIQIDEFGNPSASPENRSELRDLWWAQNPSWLHGATAAYDVSFLRGLPTPARRVLYEDIALIHVLALAGQPTLRSRDSLVYYRRHSANISRRICSSAPLESKESLNMERWRHGFEAACYAVSTEGFVNPGARAETSSLRYEYPVDIHVLKARRDMFRLLSDWPSISGLDRLVLCYCGFKAGSFRTCFARAFGWKAFSVLKSAQ